MSEEARNAKNEYMRAYRAANKERMAEISRRYWERKASQARNENEKAESEHKEENQ